MTNNRSKAQSNPKELRPFSRRRPHRFRDSWGAGPYCGAVIKGEVAWINEQVCGFKADHRIHAHKGNKDA